MKLHRKNRTVAHRQALVAAVKKTRVAREDAVGHFVFGLQAEVVVLARDGDLSARVFQDGVVGAVVSERHFVGVNAEGASEDLVSEADAEDRQGGTFAHDPAESLLGVSAGGGGVAGSVGEEKSVRLAGEDLLGVRGGGDDSHARAEVGEVTQNVALDAEINSDNMTVGISGGGAVGAPEFLRPVVRLAAGNIGGEVGAFQSVPGAEFFQRFVNVDVRESVGLVDKHRARRAAVADAPRESAGVNVRDGGSVVLAQPVVEVLPRAPV